MMKKMGTKVSKSKKGGTTRSKKVYDKSEKTAAKGKNALLEDKSQSIT